MTTATDRIELRRADTSVEYVDGAELRMAEVAGLVEISGMVGGVRIALAYAALAAGDTLRFARRQTACN